MELFPFFHPIFKILKLFVLYFKNYKRQMVSWNCKHVQHVKIYLPCNFEVNLITYLGVIALFSSIFFFNFNTFRLIFQKLDVFLQAVLQTKEHIKGYMHVYCIGRYNYWHNIYNKLFYNTDSIFFSILSFMEDDNRIANFEFFHASYFVLATFLTQTHTMLKQLTIKCDTTDKIVPLSKLFP